MTNRGGGEANGEMVPGNNSIRPSAVVVPLSPHHCMAVRLLVRLHPRPVVSLLGGQDDQVCNRGSLLIRVNISHLDRTWGDSERQQLFQFGKSLDYHHSPGEYGPCIPNCGHPDAASPSPKPASCRQFTIPPTNVQLRSSGPRTPGLFSRHRYAVYTFRLVNICHPIGWSLCVR